MRGQGQNRLIRERHPNDKNLVDNDFSEIHLFFDHDAHSHPEMTNQEYYEMLINIVETFNNETEMGKLYISYPMVEAFKDCRPMMEGENLPCDCFWNLDDNRQYKEFAADRSVFLMKNQKQWFDVIGINYLKARRLIRDEGYKISDYFDIDEITQENILINQYDKNIKSRNEVLILSAVPFFLMGYFGQSLFEQIPFRDLNTGCLYFCC